MQNTVILVDTNDREVGTEEKLKAHREGKLHRAFSIFVFNTQGELLLHKRAITKYHTGGLWTNTCCSHPHPGEDLEQATHRRLQEEMGFDCPLQKAFCFMYRVKFDKDNLFEHEFDHVFIGTCDAKPQPDPTEVEDFKWMSLNEIVQDVQQRPECYTYWFKEALEKVVDFVQGECLTISNPTTQSLAEKNL